MAAMSQSRADLSLVFAVFLALCNIDSSATGGKCGNSLEFILHFELIDRVKRGLNIGRGNKNRRYCGRDILLRHVKLLHINSVLGQILPRR